jgi:hypothetical protein
LIVQMIRLSQLPQKYLTRIIFNERLNEKL